MNRNQTIVGLLLVSLCAAAGCDDTKVRNPFKTCETYVECCDASILPAEVQIGKETVQVRASSNDRCEAGIGHMRNKDWDRAIAELKEAIAEKETDHCAHYALGVAYEKAGDKERALEHYKRANFHKGLPNYGQAVARLDKK